MIKEKRSFLATFFYWFYPKFESVLFKVIVSKIHTIHLNPLENCCKVDDVAKKVTPHEIFSILVLLSTHTQKHFRMLVSFTHYFKNEL